MPAVIQHSRRVSILLPMTSEGGKRLERYLKSKTSRDRGGLRGLAQEVGISTDSMYKWFRGETEPTLEPLGKLARVLGVTRSELVAVYDGERPSADLADVLDPTLREQFAELVARQVEEQFAAMMSDPQALAAMISAVGRRRQEPD